MKFQSAALDEATFDLTPMIDVVLLLIIFFMLTAQFTRGQERALDLPKEQGHKLGTAAESAVVINIDAGGGVSVSGQDRTLEQLAALLRAAVGKAGSADALEVTVRADRACGSDRLNEVATVLMTLGVRRWALATAGGGA